MHVFKIAIIFLTMFLAVFFISCGGGHHASHSPNAVDQQLDFESLGDDWSESGDKAEDEIDLEDGVPSVTV